MVFMVLDGLVILMQNETCMQNHFVQTIVEKGREFYYRLKPELEKKYNQGDYVSFEVESGDYFIGKTSIESLLKAKKKYPNKQFFLAQVGSIAGILK